MMQPHKILLRILPICSLLGLLYFAAPEDASSRRESREFFSQSPTRDQRETLRSHGALLGQIIGERTNLLWGAEAAKYLSSVGTNESDGLYYSDSLLIRRQSCWRSSEFAQDLDFIDLSLYTVDGVYSLREMYAINRVNGAWGIVDSAGYPLFERTIDLSSETIESEDDLKRFLVTLLSYADYGTNHILSTVDTVYHAIPLKDTIEEFFYPFDREIRGDTSEIIFTTCSITGVEVTRWNLLWEPTGIIIQESELLLDYNAMPIVEDTTLETVDSSALAGLLSDVPGDSGSSDAVNSLGDEGSKIPGRGFSERAKGRIDAEGGNAPIDGTDSAGTPTANPDFNRGPRLADLIAGNNPQTPGGHVSFEVLSADALRKSDSALIEQIPEFINFSEPIYPPLALEQRIEAEIELKARIDTLGKARQVILLKKSGTNIGFEASAKTAAAQSTFRPGVMAGVISDMWLNYRLSFRLAATAPTGGAPADPQILDSLQGDSLLDSLTDSLGDTLSDTLTDSLTDSLLDTLRDSILDTLSDTLSDTPRDTLSGSSSDTVTTDSAQVSDSASVVDSLAADSTEAEEEEKE